MMIRLSMICILALVFCTGSLDALDPPSLCYSGFHEGWSFKQGKLEHEKCKTTKEPVCVKFSYKDTARKNKYVQYWCAEDSTLSDACEDKTINGYEGTICVCKGNLCNGNDAIRSSIVLAITSIVMAKMC